MKWISVKEQLPEFYIISDIPGNVLAFNEKNNLYYVARYIKNINKWMIDYCCEDIIEVTHWMPLPPAPSSQQCETKCLRCKN